jgi:hypothetical protein
VLFRKDHELGIGHRRHAVGKINQFGTVHKRSSHKDEVCRSPEALFLGAAGLRFYFSLIFNFLGYGAHYYKFFMPLFYSGNFYALHRQRH